MDCVWRSKVVRLVSSFFFCLEDGDIEMGHARFAFEFLSSELDQSDRRSLTCKRRMFANLSTFSADVISLSLFVSFTFYKIVRSTSYLKSSQNSSLLLMLWSIGFRTETGSFTS
jgi:hypothetical protein